MTHRLARLMALVAAGTLLAGCSSGGSAVEGRPSSPYGVSSTAAASQADLRLAAIYVAALRAHLAMNPAVANPLVIGATYAGSATSVPSSVQAAITDGLQPRFDVSWSEHASPGPTGGSSVRLPRVPATGDRVKVHLSTYCGNVCGTFVTWLVSRRGDAWSARATGGIGQA